MYRSITQPRMMYLSTNKLDFEFLFLNLEQINKIHDKKTKTDDIKELYILIFLIRNKGRVNLEI